MAKQARIEEIQYLRGFAFLAVVLQHSIGHYAYLPETGLENGAVLALLLIAAKFAVPMFIFITGLVLFYNYREKVSFVPFVRKRFKDIVLPYIIWSTVYAIFFGETGTSFWMECKRILLDWFTGKASYHLWYVVMSIQLYLLFPFIQSGVLWFWGRTKPWMLRVGFVLLCVAYVALTTEVGSIGSVAEGMHVPVITPLFTEYADRNALYFCIYFIMGAAAGLNVQVWKQWMMKTKWLWISLYLLCSMVLFYKIVRSFQTSTGYVIQYNDTLLVQPFMAVFLMLSVIAMSIAAVVLHDGTSERLRSTFSYLGKHSYGAYLAHALMLTFATGLSDRLVLGGNISVRTVVAFVICTVLSLLLTVVLSKFNIGRLIVGAPAPRKPGGQARTL
ncbi:acyltransferase [Paenibacillus sp. RC67]|uniref:acyltransferase n=1 Tax=Paenibacillus sp. RC67 TaxID=3039392 RepID=UPI0024AD2BA6|nr:acyltransferase [Paenibacillus sp. RC67]